MKANLRMTRNQVADVNQEAVFADGFENALIGVTNGGQAVYDRDGCVRILRLRDGMSREDAWETLTQNVERGAASEGDYGPIFIELGREKSLKLYR